MEARLLERISKRLNEVVKHLAAFLLAAMTILVFSQVLFRYLLEVPLDWSEELSTFTFVWMALLGASVGLKRNEHPRLDLFFNFFPKGMQKIVTVLCNFAILFMLMVLFVYGWKLTVSMKSQLTAALQYSVSFVYVVLPISAAIMFIHLAIQTIFLLDKKAQETPK
ncbi:MAG: TRAP transporter small permease [Deltaproteobacteria bacterium]|nr:TRAP transporter small permease [Deltaproteobacteria bacterium]MBM4346989.1 TRAP transporter small permease [Deltaproteobacteria bacterium]